MIAHDSVYAAKLFVLAGREGGLSADHMERLFTKL